MKTISITLLLILFATQTYGQNVGIGTSNPHHSSALDITSTDSGILIPRMDSLNMEMISSPAEGLLVYLNDKNTFNYYDGIAWKPINKGIKIIDDDGDTFIKVDDGADNDEIEFYIEDNNLATIKTNSHGDFLLDIKATFLSNLMIGSLSGWSITTGAQNVGIGNGSLIDLTTGSSNVAVGTQTLSNVDSSTNNTALGSFSLRALKKGNGNTAIGSGTLNQGENFDYNTAIGYQSQKESWNTYDNTSLGSRSLRYNSNGGGNLALGSESLYSSTSGSRNTALGTESMYDNLAGSGNVAIGHKAGYKELGSNKLYIENTDSTNPLIYGDFAEDSVKIYGTLSIGNRYTFPRLDGSPNQILSTDGNGLVTWKKNIASELKDMDADTYIEVDDGADNDEISFFIDNKKQAIIKTNMHDDFIFDIEGNSSSNMMFGQESGAKITSGRSNTAFGNYSLSTLTSSANNVAIGDWALSSIDSSYSNTALGSLGLSFLETGNGNVAVGKSAMGMGDSLDWNTAIGAASQEKSQSTLFNTSLGVASLYNNSNSHNNLALGSYSLNLNEKGNYNTSIGASSLRSNLMGSGNVAIGYQAGYFEQGSNKLYIENSNSITPLIYGDFENDSIKVYGNLSIGNEYSLPSIDGNPYQILATDGQGQAYWKNEEIGLVDFDGDTYIAVDDGSDIDEIRMYLANSNVLNIKKDGNNAPILETSMDNFYLKNTLNSSSLLEARFNSNQVIVNGSIGISATSPASILHVKQVDSNKGIMIESSSDLDSWNTYIDNANDYNFAFNNDLKAYILDTDGSYQVYSDRRLKNKIRRMDNVLSKVLALEANKYVYKNDSKKQTQIGFIAQEVELLFPEAVNEKDGYKSINYSVFGVLAIQAIKEQETKINELEEKMNRILVLLEEK